jgi:hypothetical protein
MTTKEFHIDQMAAISKMLPVNLIHRKTGSHLIFLLVLLGACKDKYVANLNGPAAGYLVVEGFINLSGTTNIMLTRSTGLDSPTIIPEPGAEVEIQSPNVNYILTEISNGHYAADDLILDPSQQYQLHIRTVNGHEYLSDLTNTVITPPIDSVGWTAGSDAVKIYVSTHNDHVQPGYYQWTFEETWQYTSGYESMLEYVNESLVPRPDSDLFFNCWQSDFSTDIIIANTEKLSANVIYQFPLTQIPYNSTDKLSKRYSILVRQTSLSQDWYEWNQKIKKNTEQLGSIFDAQPSETGGNIHCITNPTEPVIGFVGTTTETQNRIFIDKLQLPSTIIYNRYGSCIMDTTKDVNNKYVIPDQLQIIGLFNQGLYTPTDYFYHPLLTALLYSETDCVDCRLKGGTTVKPDFWQ